MVFQGRSIQAKVDLDLKPFTSKLNMLRENLNELSNGINVDFGASKLATQFDDLKILMRSVSEEAEKITTAFNKIEGIANLIENLGIVKAKLETIQNDVDKINRSILKSNQSVTNVAKTEERLNGIMNNGLASAKSFNSQLAYAQKTSQGLLSVHEGVTKYLVNEEEITRMSLRNIQEKDALLKEEEALLRGITSANEQALAVLNGEATSVREILAMNDDELALLREQVSLEEQKLTVQRQQTSEIGKQNAERMATPKTNQLDNMSYLPRRIGSMALTMWGFNEVMDVYNQTLGHINAESQKDYFAKRMGMDAKATANFTSELNNMQKQYQKLDMTVVGANALETASKYKVESDSLGDLTEVMAIYGSEFVKQGRSQEDSILAVNDALDGELRRLKEVGIGKEELQATGLWSGDETDKEGMLKALLQIAEERGYDKTAKDITNLSDAISVLEVKLSIDLARAFGVVEPLLRDVIKDFITMLETAEWLSSEIGKLADKVTKFLGLKGADGKATGLGNFLEQWLAWAITIGITLYGVYKVLKPILGMFGKLNDLTGGIGKGAEEVATTGGTVAEDIEKGGFKSEFKKLGRNLGIMARAFIEVAVAMLMAYALLEEAMYLIARLGDKYEAMKPQFDKGAKFLKDYGVWILAVGGAMAIALQYVDKLPDIDWKSQVKGASKIALGLAEAMLLIAEAITLLIVPMGAIALLGYMYDALDPNAIQKGNEVIGMYADALNYIASNDNFAVFIIGLTIVSGILGATGDTVAIPMAVGIASALLLVGEAIVMLIAPLKAVEVLGDMASGLNEDAIKKGSEAIGLVGDVLKALEPSIRKLLEVDLEVFGIGLVEWGNQLVNGKSGLQSLTQDVLPNLIQFVTDFSNLKMPTDTDVSAKVQAITQMANQIAPLFTAMQNLNNAIGTGGVMGKATIWLGGVMDSHMGTGLKPQLDKLYQDVSNVMDFAEKLGNLKKSNNVGTTAITQTADAIAQLKTKLDQFVSTITNYSQKIQGASVTMGNALPNGFKEGSATFGSTVISVLANGIAQVQARYPTMKSGGKTLGSKLVEGYDSHTPKLRTSVANEIKYALAELDKEDAFYNKGASLGSALSEGFRSTKSMDINSPGKIARDVAQEMEYSMMAIDNGKLLMYQGGQSLGQALYNGYNSTGNIRTNVDVLARKGVSNEQLQATARSVQANNKKNQQVPQSTTPIINIDMSNSMVVGVQDLDAKIREAVEKAIVSINSPNGAIGY